MAHTHSNFSIWQHSQVKSFFPCKVKIISFAEIESQDGTTYGMEGWYDREVVGASFL